ncbi:MAG: MXAN_6577-like cysteine-rich protein [Myxococcaceae bacterium]
MKWNLKVGVVVLAAGMGALFAGCPPQGVVCQPGTNACGDGCADFTSDRRNCGGCGLACQTSEQCQDSQCVCSEGATKCGGKCVVLATDPQNCGACGTACAEGDVCEPNGNGTSSCKSDCQSAGNTNCNSACVNFQSDPNNCGSCGNVCDNGRRCKAGQCNYDAIVACHNFGQVVGFSYTDGGAVVGPRTNMGASPAVLAAYQDVLLSADDIDNRLVQARLSDFVGFDGGVTQVGSLPNHMVVSGQHIYVVNAISNTLQIVRVNNPGDGGTHPTGLNLTTVGEKNLGQNSSPEEVALLGNSAYVVLYGPMKDPFDAGEKVVRLDVTDEANPTVNKEWDLTTLDLKSFDAGTNAPRPFSVTAFDGKIYAALNNLDLDTNLPHVAGPGILAEIDPANDSLGEIDLTANCLNPVMLATSGDELYVSCGGKVTYSPTFVAESIEGHGVVLLKKNATSGKVEVVSQWKPICPSGTSCPIPQPGRLSAANHRVVVADQYGGTAYVLTSDGTTLRDLPNVSPLQACPAPDGTTIFYSNVSYVLAFP